MSDRIENIKRLAADVLTLSRNTLVINLRFMDKVISMLNCKCIPGLGCFVVDSENIYYDPVLVLRNFSEERTKVARQYLHMILHCVYSHYWINMLAD